MFSFSWDDSFDINVSFQNATFLFNNGLILSVSASCPPAFLLFHSNTLILILLLLEKWLYNCVSCFMFKRRTEKKVPLLSSCLPAQGFFNPPVSFLCVAVFLLSLSLQQVWVNSCVSEWFRLLRRFPVLKLLESVSDGAAQAGVRQAAATV